jgi:threonine dehydrogenase-like Zn-dependent dehydrogenase
LQARQYSLLSDDKDPNYLPLNAANSKRILRSRKHGSRRLPAKRIFHYCFSPLTRQRWGIIIPIFPWKGMAMKAFHIVTPRRFDRIDVPVPALPRDSDTHILVRTTQVSLCGSDIPFFTGKKRLHRYPLAVGAPIHECIGEVVESTFSRLHPGDRVLSIPDGNQGLAQYFIAQAARTVMLRDEIKSDENACIIQPLSTVLNAVDRLGDIRDKTFAVIGLGSIGLMFCWLAARRGAGTVIGIDPGAHRCEVAIKSGATHTICRNSIEVVQHVRVHPGVWNSADVCVEAVGHQMDTINDCMELVRKQGTVLAFGVPDHNVYALEYETFFRKNAVLMATVTPEWTAYMSKAQDLFIENRVELSRLVTHRLPIRDTQRAFELYERHEDRIIKAILDASVW